MEDYEDGDTLSKHQEEQLQKFIAQLNVYSQHKKVMAETTRQAKEEEIIKNNKLWGNNIK